jgi:glycosyltransferase involved in cell wall biosynthesis
VVIPIRLLQWPLLRPLSYALLSFAQGLLRAVGTRPDIVYYRWMDSPHALILAKLLGTRCVCEVNGDPAPDWTGRQNRPARWLRHGLARFALTHCDRVVVLTEGLKHLLVRRYAVPPQRITVLPSGTDLRRFTAHAAAVCRRELGLPPDRLYVGFVGSFYRYQGLQCLLDAMVKVKQVCPSAHLLLVGAGEAAEELHAQAERLGLANSVTWAGRVPYEKVPMWIGATNICVAPFRSDRGETSPVKVFDYLACRRPVVASRIACVEAAFPQDSGVQLVPPDDPGPLADAVVALLRDPARCAVMGKQGRQFVERRSGWSAITGQLRGWIGDQEGSSYHAHSRVLR